MKLNSRTFAQWYYAAIFAVVLVSTAALARVAEPGVRNKPSESDVPFYTIEKGTKSGIKAAERLCIKEEEDYVALWRRHRAGSLVSDTAPHVDFEHCMVIAIFQGENSNESGFVEIDRVKLLSDKVLVIVKEAENGDPKSDRATTMSFHIAKTVRNSLPVVFQ